MPDLKQKEPVSYNKYHAFTYHTCENRNKIYEFKHIFQYHLKQFLSNPTLLPLFSLNSKPHLEPDLYQTLKQWAQEEDYMWDNKEELEEDIGIKQSVSEIYLPLQ